MLRLHLLLSLILLLDCSGRREPDYFPLVSGTRRLIEISARKIEGADTIQKPRRRLVESVSREEVSGLGRVWVVTTTHDSEPPTRVFFRKDKAAVTQTMMLRGKRAELTYLSLPLYEGKKWHDNESKQQVFQVVGKESVTVEAGTFADCFKVAVLGTTADWAMHLWLASGIGPVKWETRAAWNAEGKRHELLRVAELVSLQVPRGRRD